MNRHEREADAAKTERSREEPQKLIGAAPPTSGVPVGPLATAEELHRAAERYMQSGHPAAAEDCCRQALALDAGHADSLHFIGTIALAAQQNDAAIDWFARAIRQVPQARYLVDLGMALRRLGRLEEALKAYDKALLFAPEDAAIWTDMGHVLTEAERYEESALSFEHALKLDSRLPEAAGGRGRALFHLGRYDEALTCFDLANELRANDPEFVHGRAYCLLHLNRLDEGFVETNRALVLNPGNIEAHNNLAVILQSRGRYAEAIVHFRAALALRPDHAMTRWNLALLHLLLGDFEAGWAGREWRWKVPSLGLKEQRFWQPKWLGDAPLGGKTVLLHSDEGLGDALQFARYATMVAARGARVILQVQDSICPVLRGMSGVAECLPRSSALVPEFDLHCPLSSLPLAFGTRLETIPSAVPYLPAPPPARRQFWDDRLGRRDDRLRVGLVWSGNPAHKNDWNRSTTLAMLAPLLDLEVNFVSLQKEVRDQDRAMLRERGEIVDPTGDLTDFAETAALVSCLDLVISVDTSVAHLAGALACPVWILLPFNPDFRWLLGRDDSPWYPTARLFRQSETRDYGPVVERVRLELAKMIAARRPTPAS